MYAEKRYTNLLGTRFLATWNLILSTRNNVPVTRNNVFQLPGIGVPATWNNVLVTWNNVFQLLGTMFQLQGIRIIRCMILSATRNTSPLVVAVLIIHDLVIARNSIKFCRDGLAVSLYAYTWLFSLTEIISSESSRHDRLAKHNLYLFSQSFALI